MTKETIIYNGEKTVSSINGAGKTGQLHEHSLTLHTKINSKLVSNLKLSLDTIQLVEENIGRTLFDISYSNIFLSPPPRVIKTNK